MAPAMTRDASRTAPPGGPGIRAGSGGIPPAASPYRDGSDQGVRAAAFAWLARQTLAGMPGNLPGVTGARHPVVLGAIHPA